MKKLIAIVFAILILGVPVFAQENETYYTTTRARLRSCPQTSCTILKTLSTGTAIEVLETIEGTRVSNSTEWYRVQIDGKEGYIHSSLTTDSAPTTLTDIEDTVSGSTTNSAATTITPPATAVAPANTQRPRNCAEAVAWGLTPQQAAQWPHLDRDKDGVACYGD